MYSTSIPLTAGDFFDRRTELGKLEEMARRGLAGVPSWLALIGPRKIGKTSLLLELGRRTTKPGLVFTMIDCFEELPLIPDIFRRYALRLVDGALGAELGTSLEALSGSPAEFRAALQHSPHFDSLPPHLRIQILELAETKVTTSRIHALLDLPERLAEALDLHFLVIWDEFQELAVLSSQGRDTDLLRLMRSCWQRHQRTSYVISGSARTTLKKLVTDQHSPFFQHFSLMELGPFGRREAQELLSQNAPADWPVSTELAERIHGVVGGHPFYLQLLGDALTRQPRQDENVALKRALQDLLFSRTGRLALYFENEFQRLVGRSGLLAKTLEVLAHGPRRLSEIAQEIQSASGSTVRYLERLNDAVVRSKDGRYRLADPVFGLWLTWRQPGGTVVPMGVVGDEAELTVAKHLAKMGFDLVYQSRASRGAFDLLATRGSRQLGIQVKRSPLPLRFRAAEWGRMQAESKNLGWRWIVAAVTPPSKKPTPENHLVLLDPALAKVKRGVTLAADAAIENLLLWMDRPHA